MNISLLLVVLLYVGFSYMLLCLVMQVLMRRGWLPHVKIVRTLFAVHEHSLLLS